MPKFSEDDYVDFCVLEALVLKATTEEKEAERQREIEAWKKKAGQELGPKGRAKGGRRV